MNRPRKKDKHLPQCVYFKNGAYWYVKRGKWTRLGSTLPEATKRWAAIYEGAPGSMAALIHEAMPTITEGRKPNTANQYKIAGKKLAKMLAEFRPCDVTHSTVANIRKDLRKTPNMANRCLSVLRLVFHYATENEVVTDNPVIGAVRFKEAKRKRLLTMEELAAIYEASVPRMRVIIDLSIRTGQRIGDVLKIRRADLLPEGIRFEQQKTGAKVIVPWTDELRDVVARAKSLHVNIKAMTLLHNRRGKVPDYRTVRHQWDTACEKAGVTDAHLHDLRAFAATYAKRQGLSAKTLLGHTNASQTERYLRDRDAVLAEGPSFGHSMNLLDKARKNAGN